MISIELDSLSMCVQVQIMKTITARQRSCWKVMFSVVSVHHSVPGGEQGGSHVPITRDALDLNVQLPPRPPGHQTWDFPWPCSPTGNQTWVMIIGDLF